MLGRPAALVIFVVFRSKLIRKQGDVEVFPLCLLGVKSPGFNDVFQAMSCSSQLMIQQFCGYFRL